MGGGRAQRRGDRRKTVRDLRIAEVLRQDVVIEDGKIKSYRVRLAISFKYETGD